jgi:hypothetical protein
VDTDGAARILGVTFKWMVNSRKNGYGPPYIRLGLRLVRYDVSVLKAWVAANTIDPSRAA